MALKNHALDEKIICAAQEEFLDKGFRDASLHQIAAKAGITTGALYTRYRSKDDLFRSLVQVVLDAVADQSRPIADLYQQAHEARDPALILQAIRQEEAIYHDLLFRCPEACTLFFCRSGGSSLDRMLQAMMEEKSRSTVDYFKSMTDTDLDLDGIGLLISSQFFFFRQILERGYDRDKALACMKLVERYMDAGWNALFQAIF